MFDELVLVIAVAVLTTVVVLTILWNKGSFFIKEDIKGRNIVITGASKGIGEQLAYRYAELGANVFITARSESSLKNVIEKCKLLNPRGIFGYYAADMDNFKTESKMLIQIAVKLLKGIDTLIVNHAYFGNLVVWHGTEEELALFEKMSGINYNSYVHIASHALPYLKSAPRGRLGVVSSDAGKKPYIMAATYCGSKFALDGFFSTVRDELKQAKTKVTVTLAVLGSIATESSNNFIASELERLQMTSDDIVTTADDVVRTPEDAAQEILEATETGIDELYFPHWFRTLYGTMPASWLPIMRHMASTLTKTTTYTESFYKKQDELTLPRENN